MAVLKMGSFGDDKTWLTEVDKVVQRFFVKRETETCSARDLMEVSLVKMGRTDILDDLKSPGYCSRYCSAVPDTYDGEISLLKVFRGNYNSPDYRVEYWLAPVENTWLMSEDGKTIDRL